MAKPKATKTAVQIAADKARDAFNKAKEAHEKAGNAANKAALDKATEARNSAVEVENAERFVNVGGNRTRKARAAIRQLIKVANPKSYKFNADQSGKIITGLKQAVAEVERAFAATGGTAKASDDFAL